MSCQLQRLWDHIFQHWCSGDEFLLAVVGTFTVNVAVLCLSNSLLILLDTTGRPQWLLKYKIQKDKQVWKDMPKFWKALRLVTFNTVVVGFPFTWLLYGAMKWRGCSFSGSSLQGLVHHPRLYRHIHKTHHEWTAPMGLSSVYAHPVEYVASTLLCVAVGPVIMGFHLAVAWLWFAVAIWSITIAHCGYHFPLLPSPEAHDYHHLKFDENFGSLAFLDTFHGTNVKFKASEQFSRHKTLWRLEPFTRATSKSTKRT